MLRRNTNKFSSNSFCVSVEVNCCMQTFIRNLVMRAVSLLIHSLYNAVVIFLMLLSDGVRFQLCVTDPLGVRICGIVELKSIVSKAKKK